MLHLILFQLKSLEYDWALFCIFFSSFFFCFRVCVLITHNEQNRIGTLKYRHIIYTTSLKKLIRRPLNYVWLVLVNVKILFWTTLSLCFSKVQVTTNSCEFPKALVHSKEWLYFRNLAWSVFLDFPYESSVVSSFFEKPSVPDTNARGGKRKDVHHSHLSLK